MAFDFDELLEEAVGRIGGEEVSGQEARAGRRAFKLMLGDWSNRGVSLWTLDEIVLQANAAKTLLPADTIDVAEVFVRKDGDRTLTRIGRAVYADIADKDRVSDPELFFVDRQRSAPVLHLHPVPKIAEIHVWRVRAFEDAKGMSSALDMPPRFYEAAAAGLAFFMFRARIAKDPNASEVHLALLDRLDSAYREAREQAMEADRENANLRFEFDLGGYFG